MAPKKASKKREATDDIGSIDGDIILHTTPHAVDSIKSWRQIYDLLDYEIRTAPTNSENHLRDIAESELHKIAARPWLMAYNNMIHWALEKVDITTRSI